MQVYDAEISTKLVSLANTISFISRETLTVRTTCLVDPKNIHEVSLHVVKFGVWCAISATTIFAPIFKNNTLQTLRPLFRCLYDYEIMYVFVAK